MVEFVFSTRIMGRPVHQCVTIKIIINVGGGKDRSKGLTMNRHKPRWRWRILTRVSHVFNDLTLDAPFLPINQASSSRMTNQPVVDVAFDEDLSAELFPYGEIHGVEVCFTQRRGYRDRDVESRIYLPVRPRCNSI